MSDEKKRALLEEKLKTAKNRIRKLETSLEDAERVLRSLQLQSQITELPPYRLLESINKTAFKALKRVASCPRSE